MKTNKKTFLFFLLQMIVFIAMGQSSKNSAFSISFTKVPGPGGGPARTEIIEGKVSGPNLAECQIVLYAKAGEKWWVQPFADSPYTRINKDLTWSNETHLGIQYAALLVKKGFVPDATCLSLPSAGENVKKIAITSPSKSSSGK